MFDEVCRVATTICIVSEWLLSILPDMGSFPAADDFTWLASQNNFQFDPQLFGDYREPQENILGTNSNGLDDNFFNDAFAADFTTPYNMAPSPVTQKKAAPDLVAQIDAAKNSDEVGPDGQLLTCNTIWYDETPDYQRHSTDSDDREKLQTCSRVQSGDFDLDGLCSELQTKAKCSGNGPVVNEKDFKSVMGRYLGKTEEEMADCDVVKGVEAVSA
jgi:AP-1-like transcription factor